MALVHATPTPTARVIAGRYIVRDVLGVGGGSEVLCALDRTTGLDVAVKILHDRARLADPEARRRLETEASALARLRHPNIVRLLDSGTDDDEPFLVLELIRGRSLEEYLAMSGPLGPERAVALLAPVADALAWAHGRGVVHRDVKPSNILIGDDRRVRLADFGIARLQGTAMLTAPGMMIGTLAYLAPEQVRGAALGPKTDVYALGLVLLEAATGERPFEGTLAESAARRLHGPPALPADLPPWFRNVVTSATQVSSHERPDAAALADTMRRPATMRRTAVPAVRGSAGTRLLSRTTVLPAPVPPPRPPVVHGSSARRWRAGAVFALATLALGGAIAAAVNDASKPDTVQVPAGDPSTTAPATTAVPTTVAPTTTPPTTSAPAPPAAPKPGKAPKKDHGKGH
jgi:eukaryotic-like serine/threonine-protein kinase